MGGIERYRKLLKDYNDNYADFEAEELIDKSKELDKCFGALTQDEKGDVLE